MDGTKRTPWRQAIIGSLEAKAARNSRRTEFTRTSGIEVQETTAEAGRLPLRHAAETGCGGVQRVERRLLAGDLMSQASHHQQLRLSAPSGQRFRKREQSVQRGLDLHFGRTTVRAARANRQQEGDLHFRPRFPRVEPGSPLRLAARHRSRTRGGFRQAPVRLAIATGRDQQHAAFDGARWRRRRLGPHRMVQEGFEAARSTGGLEGVLFDGDNNLAVSICNGDGEAGHAARRIQHARASERFLQEAPVNPDAGEPHRQVLAQTRGEVESHIRQRRIEPELGKARRMLDGNAEFGEPEIAVAADATQTVPARACLYLPGRSRRQGYLLGALIAQAGDVDRFPMIRREPR